MEHWGVDWANEEDKKRAFDGKKILKSMPKPKKGLTIATENMPSKQCKEYTDAGGRVFRCATHWVKKGCEHLGWEKTDENAAKIIWLTFENLPQYFYEWQHDPRLSELKGMISTYLGIQDVRKAMGNRSWANPDSKLLKQFHEELGLQEKRVQKEIKKMVRTFPIWNDFLKDEKGVGEISGGRVIARYGNPDRFKKLEEMYAYFGLHVVNGKAPRLQKGVRANWNMDGRVEIIGVIVSGFVKMKRNFTNEEGTVEKRSVSPWRDTYDAFKKDYASRGLDAGVVESRTRRKVGKLFMRKFFRAYKRIHKSTETLEAVSV